MPDRLSQEAQEAIRRIVSGMVKNQGLEEASGEELRGHLEDKTLAYLNGDERLSEKDALLLAREHFGEQAKLVANLAEVHGTCPSLMSDRPVLALFILFFALGCVQAGITSSLRLLPHFLLLAPGILLLTALSGLAVQFILLRGWKRQLEGTGEVWYLQWKLSHLRFLFLLVFLGASLRGIHPPLPLATVFTQQQILFFLAVTLLVAAVPFVLALWWYGVNRSEQCGRKLIGRLIGVIWLNGIPATVAYYCFLDPVVNGQIRPASSALTSILATGVSQFVLLAIPAGLALALFHFFGPRKSTAALAPV